MDQTAGSTPADAPAPAQSDSGPTQAPPAEQPGFGSRGRARRRARFLRRARELAYRDLGGLVFNLHRFGQRNDALVLAKLGTLTRIDSELRAIEDVLRERRPLTVLREAGITACPRCAAIHSGEDRFCPNCGLPMSRKSDLPIAGAAESVAPAGSPGVVAPSTAAA
ncbi:MAG TPA: zinc ribbon domain-containing protein, partial [Solirubrobacteraceae bacterium]